METINDRAKRLIKMATIDEIADGSGIKFSRWRTVTYNKDVRMSTEELDVIVRRFPRFALWLVTGQVAPEAGQVSPEYEEAEKKLAGQKPA